MKAAELEHEIDALYRLPLDQFTSARNALARTAGAAGGDIRALQKPPVAAWAVNQIYWQRRATYDKLVDAAATLRAAHAAVLSGKRADLRSAGKDHEEALEEALKAGIAVLQASGHPATDATRQAIASTLRGLPSDAAPGRLTRVLQPGGFEMLAGIPIKAAPGGKPAVKSAPAPAPAAGRETQQTPGPDPKALGRAREALENATRALKIADQAARREEFEAARAARDAEKSEKALASAREELESARRAVDEAEEQAAAAERRRKEAAKSAAQSETALQAARARVAEAERALEALTNPRRR